MTTAAREALDAIRKRDELTTHIDQTRVDHSILDPEADGG